MYLNWTRYGLYWYFKLMRRYFCIRFIPHFNNFSKDKRRLTMWEVKRNV